MKTLKNTRLALLSAFTVFAVFAVILSNASFAEHHEGGKEMNNQAATEEAMPEKANEAAATENAAQEDNGLDIEKILADRAIGDPNAPIIIEEFSSLTCPHCAGFHNKTLPTLKEEYIDTGKVYLIFRDFPLNRLALNAAMTSRCMPAENYYDFITILFKTQDEWAFEPTPATLFQTSKLAGLSNERLQKCASNDELVKQLVANMQEKATKYEIRSTPTFILNGGAETISGAADIETFRAKLDAMLAQMTPDGPMSSPSSVLTDENAPSIADQMEDQSEEQTEE